MMEMPFLLAYALTCAHWVKKVYWIKRQVRRVRSSGSVTVHSVHTLSPFAFFNAIKRQKSSVWG